MHGVVCHCLSPLDDPLGEIPRVPIQIVLAYHDGPAHPIRPTCQGNVRGFCTLYLFIEWFFLLNIFIALR
jgi:hypothetical protein